MTTDDNGNFFAIVWYPCDGPTPNLYFSAEQLQGSNWVTIYDPWVRCGTYWNYACGTSVVLNVTDPAAIPCAAPDPVNPPAGADSWVLVTAVGGTFVWGTAPATAPPVGWLQQDGLTDYGSTVDAPFGGYLGFRSGASIDIPRTGATYYRWSYRAMGTTPWFFMSDTVVRHYVKETPPALPTFPVETMGPLTVGSQSSLYLFKPLNPPGLRAQRSARHRHLLADRRSLRRYLLRAYLDTTSIREASRPRPASTRSSWGKVFDAAAESGGSLARARSASSYRKAWRPTAR